MPEQAGVLDEVGGGFGVKAEDEGRRVDCGEEMRVVRVRGECLEVLQRNGSARN